MWDKNDSKKGFTLIEMIVVLVILSILAAATVPSMLGWIRQAQEKQSLLEARNVYLAAQEAVYELYAKDPSSLKSLTTDDIEKTVEEITNIRDVSIEEIRVDSDTGVLTGFVYRTSKGAYAKYENDQWEIDLEHESTLEYSGSTQASSRQAGWGVSCFIRNV